MEEVLGNIKEEMDLPSFFRWLDEEKPQSSSGQGEEQLVGASLSKRAETLMVTIVDSAQEDMQHKLQLMVDNIRERVSVGRHADRQTDGQTERYTCEEGSIAETLCVNKAVLQHYPRQMQRGTTDL